VQRQGPDRDLLLTALVRPVELADLTEAEWDALLPRARSAHLLAHLGAGLSGCDRTGCLPDRVRNHLAAAAALATRHERVVRWEINRIERALRHLDVPVLLLKGAAYVAVGLPAATTRLVSDTDIMVPGAALDTVEGALASAGWQPLKLDPYDQRYYRTWMHELPPLCHRERGTVVDLHHTILPRTSRLKPDPKRLWAAARRLGAGPLHVLAPTDMVLHAAAHLFHDGDLQRSLRDLVDIKDLLTHFGQVEPDFWSDLVPQAVALGLERPLFYALRFSRRLLGTPIPEPVVKSAAKHAPPVVIIKAMDQLVPRTLVPGYGSGERGTAMLLYIRSHWLRMPPWLLARHLAHQTLARLKHDRH
jgi:Uncharacterised nucleotidyltransferase